MRATVLALAAGTALIACRVSELDRSPPGPAIALTVGSDQLDLPQGLAVLTVVNVTRSGNYTGDVGVTVEGVPDGMRALASSPETVDGVTSELVAIGTDRDFPAGIYPLTVRATAGGVADVLGLLTVTVTPAGSGVYALEIRPISVAQGAESTALVSINRADFFNVAVKTTVEHIPAGVTVTIYPEENFKALSTMTIGVSPAVPAGHYTLTLRGSSEGLADRIAIVPLIVVPAGP